MNETRRGLEGAQQISQETVGRQGVVSADTSGGMSVRDFLAIGGLFGVHAKGLHA